MSKQINIQGTIEINDTCSGYSVDVKATEGTPKEVVETVVRDFINNVDVKAGSTYSINVGLELRD